MLPMRKPLMMSDFPSLFSTILKDDLNGLSTRRNMPAVNVFESENNYTIEVAAPGLNKKDFSINLEDNLLTIELVQEQKNESEDKKYTLREFAYINFKRTFTIPESIEGEKIKAGYKDGILLIELPKKEEAKPKAPRKISIG